MPRLIWVLATVLTYNVVQFPVYWLLTPFLGAVKFMCTDGEERTGFFFTSLTRYSETAADPEVLTIEFKGEGQVTHI